VCEINDLEYICDKYFILFVKSGMNTYLVQLHDILRVKLLNEWSSENVSFIASVPGRALALS
jgi:hypothetical protein